MDLEIQANNLSFLWVMDQVPEGILDNTIIEIVTGVMTV